MANPRGEFPMWALARTDASLLPAHASLAAGTSSSCPCRGQKGDETEKIVFTKELFACWPCVQCCAVGCAPLGMALMSCTGCCNYCSGTEFQTITQPVYKGPWKRSTGGDPVKIGELVQSYRFTPVGPCCSIRNPLKFYFRPTNDGGVTEAVLPLINLSLMIYRGLPVPCKCCSPVEFQIPTGVWCLDCGLNTTTEWKRVEQVMSEADG